MTQPLTAHQVRCLLEREVKGFGTQKAFADKIGISQQFLSDILLDRREPTGKVLDFLGLERCVTYRKAR